MLCQITSIYHDGLSDNLAKKEIESIAEERGVYKKSLSYLLILTNNVELKGIVFRKKISRCKGCSRCLKTPWLVPRQ